VEFSQNVGYIIMRQHSTLRGTLCKQCINQEFWHRTLITLFFGWWGTVSLFVAPVYIVRNTFRFVPTLGMHGRLAA